MLYKIGDMVKCEYIPKEFAKGRILSVQGNKAEVEIAIPSRKSKDIYKDIIEINIDKIQPLIKVR